MSKKTKKGFGAIEDTRPQSKKDRDFKFVETVASVNPVNWVVKKTWRKFPVYDQNGSGSCVAQTVAKMLGIMYWLLNGVYVHFSATHVYQRRSNKPQAGMIGMDAGEIAMSGVTLEELVPSQKMTDSEMDNVQIEEYKVKVGEIFKSSTPIVLPFGGIDVIASTIQTTGKPVMLWFFFDLPEWTVTPLIKNPNLDKSVAEGRHSVTGVDFTLLSKDHTSDKKLWGKKAIIIDDSWGTSYGQKGQRFITEDFFNSRNYFAMYFQGFKFSQGASVKPQYTFKRDLEYKPSAPVTYGDPDVVALQNILKYEGLFPHNVDSTGYFGSLTKQKVIEFQAKYHISPQSGFVGALTRAKLNELYGS